MRQDFQGFCAYCFRHEDEIGVESFVLDHFEPQSFNSARVNDYSNLYWSCAACNAPQNKNAHWPSPTDLAAGYRFCDPCDHDPVGTDYRELRSGRLKSQTPAGEYTIDHIGLDRRPILVQHRRNRREVRRQYKHALTQLQRALKVLSSKERLSERQRRALAALELYEELYRRFLERSPFLLAHYPPAAPVVLIQQILEAVE